MDKIIVNVDGERITTFRDTCVTRADKDIKTVIVNNKNCRLEGNNTQLIMTKTGIIFKIMI